jgi:hypothetical protein
VAALAWTPTGRLYLGYLIFDLRNVWYWLTGLF